MRTITRVNKFYQAAKFSSDWQFIERFNECDQLVGARSKASLDPVKITDFCHLKTFFISLV